MEPQEESDYLRCVTCGWVVFDPWRCTERTCERCDKHVFRVVSVAMILRALRARYNLPQTEEVSNASLDALLLAGICEG